MNQNKVKFAFFGSSRFSLHVLNALKQEGFEPALNITSAREELPIDKLTRLGANVFIVASFGKILPAEVIYIPEFKTLNVHPSLLPRLRGPAPIQNMILGNEQPGISIIRLDEKMDHGPILAQEEVPISPWPDYYESVEEKLGRAGGRLLAKILPQWISGEIKETVQNESRATYTKMIKKEDGLLDLSDPAETNLRKVYAYHSWPSAYLFFFSTKGGSANSNGGKRREIRVMVKNAKIIDGQFIPTLITPEGKKEMPWQDFLRGNL